MKYVLPLLMLSVLTSCAKDEPLELSANFESINNDLFAQSCSNSGCHAGTSPAEGLNLESANSYDNLINIASTTDVLLVAPNDAENSYLIHKLEDRSTIDGARMPLRGDAISQRNIDMIKKWINDGASQ